MSETIETFVEKLQQDGVEAGRARAEKILAEARAEAEEIVSEARLKAEKTVEEAREEAKRIAEAQANELRLAARDALLKLREGITSALEGVLRRRTAEHLEDTQFLKELIREVVQAHLAEGGSGQARLGVTVSEQTMEQVGDWALDEIASGRVDLQNTLKGLGFEYTMGDATVEVTVEAVVEVLRQMVSARLQKVLIEAARD